jgi:3-methyladenine DNA glycosylase AlkD
MPAMLIRSIRADFESSAPVGSSARTIAGFVMMAALGVHDVKADDSAFVQFFPVMKKYATDDRNFVRKAVNWALRNIGKRNVTLNVKAIEAAREIQAIGGKSARWIAADALRELQSDKVQQRLIEKARKTKNR